MAKIHLLALTVALLASACALAEETDVYMLIGQSNMAGRGKLTPADRLPSDGIVKMDAAGKWTPAVEPLHFDKPVAGAGLAMSFARRVARPGVRVALVPCAVGGTPLSRWMPGQDLYRTAVARTKTAMKSGTLRAILWHQGEGDCADGKCETYGARLETMVRALRAELGVGDDVPFIAGELGDFLSVRHPDSKHGVVNAGIRACATNVPNFRAVSARGLTANADNLHFNTASLREFGERYARAYLSDIPYAPENGAFGLGDLYLPDGWNADTPVVLAIHGGGWVHGDRYSWSGVADFFCKDLGMAVFNVEYRLLGDACKWPACGDDCLKAAKFLLGPEFQRRYSLKPKCIWICGGSAGGHLALWTGLSLPARQVAGVVSISGIADGTVDRKAHPARYRHMTGRPFDPQTLIRAGGPRVLLTHADEDGVVPIGSAKSFFEAYRAAGCPVELFEYPHDAEPNLGGHCIWRKPSDPHRLLERIENRIREFCKKGK